MPYSKKKLSSWWIILWTVLFFGGMILLFSFLLGNPFFSGKITGKYLFSEASREASLYLDEKFIGKGEIEGNIELGQKELCARKYFFLPRCFDEEVRSNSFPVLEKKNISLFPREFRVDTLTKNKVYFDPSEGGLFWFDFEKNIIWGMRIDEESFFSQRIDIPLSQENIRVQYDNSEKLFTIKSIASLDSLDDKKSDDAKRTFSVFFPENFITLSEIKDSFLIKNEKIEFLKSSFLQIERDTKRRILLSSFSSPIQKIYSYQQNKILEFPRSVWIFTPETNSFQKILTKQEKTRIFWHKKTASIFFQEQGLLKRLYLK